MVYEPLREPAADGEMVGEGEPLMQPQKMAKPSRPGRALVPLRLSIKSVFPPYTAPIDTFTYDEPPPPPAG